LTRITDAGIVSAIPGAPIRALVFDFDGLIVDTETPIFDIWRDIFRRLGQELRIEDWKDALGTQGGYDPVAHLAALLEAPVDAEALENEARQRHWAACRKQPLLPGVRERLDEARALGLGAAVASSSSADWVNAWLEHHGIRKHFGAVCTQEDVALVKPAPDLFLLAAARLNVEPQACLVFEDSPNGIRAASAAGMRCVAVRNDVTRSLALPPSDLLLESLAEKTLAEILDRVS
jgi:HAD superfamily hydrolase (TIGR01509 family)